LIVCSCVSSIRREPSSFMNDAKFIIEQMYMASRDSVVGERRIFFGSVKVSREWICDAEIVFQQPMRTLFSPCLINPI
jgi:hypothetical protein